MEQYKKAVQEFANKQEDYTFPNKGASHAVIVLEELFNNSKEIKFFSNKLDYDILKTIFSSIKNFIKNGGVLELILDEPNIVNNDIVTYLCEKNVSIKIANDEFRNSVKKLSTQDDIYHFAIGDNKSFRIEIDTQEYKAICNFNNPEISQKFVSVFDDFFNKLDNYKGC